MRPDLAIILLCPSLAQVLAAGDDTASVAMLEKGSGGDRETEAKQFHGECYGVLKGHTRSEWKGGVVDGLLVRVRYTVVIVHD